MKGEESAVSKIRDEYAKIAQQRASGCQTPACGEGAPVSERYGYDPSELRALPDDSDMGLGCGAPVPVLKLQPGETVLDLGSGGGIDVFLAARTVGASGRVIGVDMTRQMIDLARKNAREGGYSNVEFRQGRLEDLPVDDASVDAVTSNCVINLVPDKAAVYREIARVLRPGGRLAISDIVLDGELPQGLVQQMNIANCLVTAIQRQAYLEILWQSGLSDPVLIRDIDYLAAAGWNTVKDVNEETRALLERANVDFEMIKGVIRSVTLHAVKSETA